jgi:secreted trypsin-like serine protease
MHTKALSLALALAAVTAAPAGAVSGGSALPIAQAPYIANVDVGGRCTGTLISPTRILTAGHCLDGHDANGAVIVVGIDANTAPRSQVRAAALAVRGFSVDPDFGESFPFKHDTPQEAIAFGDVGVILLKKPVTGIAPIRLGDAAPGAAAMVIGYGLAAPPILNPPPGAAPTPPTPLQQGALSVISLTDCAKLYPKALQPSMLCTQDLVQHDPHVQACAGDSGGPVIVQSPSGPVQVGVTSWGAEVMGAQCGATSLPDVAMRVSSFASFINKAKLPIEPFTLRRNALPHLTGGRHVGDTLTCHPPKFGGDPSKVSYSWQTSQLDFIQLKGQHKPTFKITRAVLKLSKQARQVYCTVTARNAGGSLSLQNAVRLLK